MRASNNLWVALAAFAAGGERPEIVPKRLTPGMLPLPEIRGSGTGDTEAGAVFGGVVGGVIGATAGDGDRSKSSLPKC